MSDIGIPKWDGPKSDIKWPGGDNIEPSDGGREWTNETTGEHEERSDLGSDTGVTG